MLLIKTKNSSIGDYKLNKSGKLLSTKQDKTDNSYHGIGMKQIHKVVKENNGFIRISSEPDSFTLEIIIPLEK